MIPLKPLSAIAITASALALAAAAPSWAQAWPTGPIRIVVGYAPGGSSDISARIVGELMFRRAGVKVLNVPYKGGGQAVQDVLGGVVPVGVLGAGPVMPYAQSARLMLLAVTSKDRSVMLPAVPTMAEASYPEIAITQWFAAFAPAGTPGEIVERLAAAYAKALADPTVRERLAAAALESVGGTPDEFSRRLATEGEAWLRRAREFGLDRH